MAREITIALAQTAPVLNDNEENLRRMAAMIQRICSEQPTNLIVFPELAVSGYECGLHFTRLAERITGHAVSYLAGKAAEFSVYLVFGMPVKEKVESILFNAAVVIGPDGELLGDYRKLHLRGEERLAFRPGYRIPVFETEFGPLGVMVGWDLAFPEVARSLALDGADLIVAPRSVGGRSHGGVAGVHHGAGVRECGVPGRGQPGGRGADLHLRRRVDAGGPARRSAHGVGRGGRGLLRGHRGPGRDPQGARGVAVLAVPPARGVSGVGAEVLR